MKQEQLILTDKERREVAEILQRRANDIATFQGDCKRYSGGTVPEYPGSVEMALRREIDRLRKLADKIEPAVVEEEDEP